MNDDPNGTAARPIIPVDEAFERWWRRTIGPIDPDRAATIVGALRRQFAARLARHPERDPERTWRSLWNAGRRHWRAALAACDRDGPLQRLWEATDGGRPRPLADVCARLLVGWMRRVRVGS